jgi:hypothetical protein
MRESRKSYEEREFPASSSLDIGQMAEAYLNTAVLRAGVKATEKGRINYPSMSCQNTAPNTTAAILTILIMPGVPRLPNDIHTARAVESHC